MVGTRRAGRARTAPWVSAIVLAAGVSRRMGASKPLASLFGRPLLEHVVENLAGSRVREVVVVLGHASDRVQREVDLGSARVVVNADYREGMSTSIRAGLRAADPSAGAYLMVLGDQPFVAAATVDALVVAWVRHPTPIVIPTFRARRGNPVLVDRVLVAAMDSVTGDRGFRALFGSRARDILEVPVKDPGILFDVDTAEDVRSLEAKVAEGLTLRAALTELVTRTRGRSN